MTIVLIALYLGIQLYIGFWVSSKIKTESDYFVAGHSLGTPLLMFSMFASWFGAETCIGTSGEVFAHGLSGSRADPFGYSLCLFLMGLILAKKLWGNYTTLADLYRERYGKLVEKISVIVLIPSSVIWAAAQMRAFGQIISVTTDLNVESSIAFAFIFITIYTMIGGILGDIYNDLIQGITIALGLIIILVAVVMQTPDISGILSSMEPARFSFIDPSETIWQRIDRWAVPVMGSLVAQEMASRIFAARSYQVARNASLASGAIYLALGSIPVFLGLIGPSVIPALADTEQFLITLAHTMLPGVLFVIFAGALVSAILATVDSILLSVSALFTHNLLIPYFKITSEKKKVLLARSIVVLSAAIAFSLAIVSEGIYELVETASSYGTAGIVVITLIGLFSPWGGKAAAAGALITGAVCTPIFERIDLEMPFLYSIGLSLLVYTLGWIIYDRKTDESDDQSTLCVESTLTE